MRKQEKKRLTRQGGKRSQGSPYIPDPTVIPRVEAYSRLNPLSDVDAVMAGLRHLHKDYQRKPQAALRQAVLKAIQYLQAKKPQFYTGSKHMGPAEGSPTRGDGDDQVDDQSDVSSSSRGDSSKADRDSHAHHSSYNEQESSYQSADKAGMNNMLLSMYARTPQQQAIENVCGRDCPPTSGQDDTTTTTPAFAPPEVIAAAAARSLAAQAGGKAGHGVQHKDGATVASAQDAQATTQKITTAIFPTTSEGEARKYSQEAGGHQNAAAGCSSGQAAQTPAAMKPNARPATEAGFPQDARGETAGKRARRMGTNADTVGRAAAGKPRVSPGLGSALGSSAVTTPRPVTYEDLGGVEDVLWSIRELIEYPITHPELYSHLGIEPPRGVLLHGPPGCGKTALANAIANKCNVPFLRVSAPEIVSGMSGESEAKLRSLFQEAAELAPCIVFIDEIDAIAPKRETAQREMERRIVAQMLTCMDDLSSLPPMTQGKSNSGQKQPEEEGRQPGSSDRTVTRQPRLHVAVIGATNRPDAIDPALRRAGRFDKEIALGVPTEAARARILEVITRESRLEGNFNFRHIAKRTPGFVGADLVALVKEAGALAVNRTFRLLESVPAEPLSLAHGSATPMLDNTPPTTARDGHGTVIAADMETDNCLEGTATERNEKRDACTSLSNNEVRPSRPRFGAGPLMPEELAGLAISMPDFEAALKKVQPSVRREGFTTTPDVTWEDVGSLDEVREELSFAITHRIIHAECFEALGLPKGAGVLLFGPPGCGKTLLAKAVANESGANFISIKGPELLSKYVGDSERAVRQLFARARAAQPCVLFFDELDALAPKRGTDNNQAAERVVMQLLTEMDGVEDRGGVYIVGATNKPESIDDALMRPGRLGKHLYVPLPTPEGRVSILQTLTRSKPLADDVDVATLGLSDKCDRFSGADLANLVQEASVTAFKEHLETYGIQLARKDTAYSSTTTTTTTTIIQSNISAAAAAHSQPGPKLHVAMRHFEKALTKIRPSVTRSEARRFEELRMSLCSGGLQATTQHP